MTVLVLGMHRSGTSVATRLVNLLGVPVCRTDDLLRFHDGYERGRWESATLVAANEELLTRVGARWWCPPAGAVSMSELADDRELSRMRSLFDRTHPATPCVWKDPRNCITLPFWREVFDYKPVVVLVTRDPHAVAASLQTSSGLSARFSFALWERHLQAAISACEDLQVLTTSYEDLLADPVRWCAATAEFLSYAGLDVTLPAVTAGIEAFVEHPTLASGATVERKNTSWILSEQQSNLAEALLDLMGPASSFSGVAKLPGETPTTELLFDELRVAYGLSPGTEALSTNEPFVSSTGISLHEPEHRRSVAHRPSRLSVVMLAAPGSDARTAEGLLPFLPDNVEIIFVEAGSAVGRGRQKSLPDAVTPVRRSAARSIAARLNLGAEVATGDVLLFCRPSLEPRSGWVQALRTALDAGGVGAVGPALVPAHALEWRVLGIAPRPGLVEFDWLSAVAAAHGEPVDVPAVSRWAMATPRNIFESAGGFDEGFVGTGVEDAELCLRLWRMGYRCVAVPEAEVVCSFPETDVESDPRAAMRDALRMALIHLRGDALQGALRELATWDGFAAALADVSSGDAGRRRVVVDALAWYSASYVLQQLGAEVARPAQTGAG